MKYFVVPTILWGYIFSVFLAKAFWTVIFGRVAESLHLGLTNAFVFLGVMNLLVASVGAPQVISFIRALKRREMMSVSQHVGSSLCISAASICLAAAILCVALVSNSHE